MGTRAAPSRATGHTDRTYILIQVISSTTREGRFSEKVATWVTQQLETREDFEIEQVDLRHHPLPFFDGAAPARTPREYARPEVERLGRTLDRADGFIAAARAAAGRPDLVGGRAPRRPPP